MRLAIIRFKAPITMQQTTFSTFSLFFYGNKAWYFMRIVCQQTIRMELQVLFGFLKQQRLLKLSSAAKFSCRFKG